ncbi:MAG: hypothetical protein ACK4V2_07885 [Pseudomonadota bacterium]
MFNNPHGEVDFPEQELQLVSASRACATTMNLALLGDDIRARS